MRGYWQNHRVTARRLIPKAGLIQAILVGCIQNDLVVTGRTKDTIVLTNGENGVEDGNARVAYIDYVGDGQDRRSLRL